MGLRPLQWLYRTGLSGKALPKFSLNPQLQENQRGYTVMASRTYDDAINLLNTLQTPYEILKRRRDAGIRIDENANLEMRKHLSRLGYTQSDLDKLNIVHVAGTKGKGSTCAYVDSILSQYRKSHDIPGKTGLFTSPHLIAVRERIRINSAPISAVLFAKYFFEVWDALEESAEVTSTPFEKPVYFRYLTLMSYHTFIQEGVNVATYEVGMGGEFDSTNVVDSPAVTGITTLGIDHTFELGDTIDKIAWNKAGIQKKGIPSLTVPQVSEAMKVLKARSEERGVKSFTVVEEDPRLAEVAIKPDASFQKGNASLAIRLAEAVLKKIDHNFKPDVDPLGKEFVEGLEQVVWRGRCEKKVEENVVWYLDGAHTAESLKLAARWYGDECSKHSGARVLIFNQQGHRPAVDLLEDFYNAIKSDNYIQFDHVLFCPTVAATINSRKDSVNLSTDKSALAELTMQKTFAKKWATLDPSSKTQIEVLSSVEDAFEYVRAIAPCSGEKNQKTHTLITGSVHLIGRALGVLEGVDAL